MVCQGRAHGGWHQEGRGHSGRRDASRRQEEGRWRRQGPGRQWRAGHGHCHARRRRQRGPRRLSWWRRCAACCSGCRHWHCRRHCRCRLGCCCRRCGVLPDFWRPLVWLRSWRLSSLRLGGLCRCGHASGSLSIPRLLSPTCRCSCWLLSRRLTRCMLLLCCHRCRGCGRLRCGGGRRLLERDLRPGPGGGAACGLAGSACWGCSRLGGSGNSSCRLGCSRGRWQLCFRCCSCECRGLLRLRRRCSCNLPLLRLQVLGRPSKRRLCLGNSRCCCLWLECCLWLLLPLLLLLLLPMFGSDGCPATTSCIGGWTRCCRGNCRLLRGAITGSSSSRAGRRLRCRLLPCRCLWRSTTALLLPRCTLGTRGVPLPLRPQLLHHVWLRCCLLLDWPAACAIPQRGRYARCTVTVGPAATPTATAAGIAAAVGRALPPTTVASSFALLLHYLHSR